MDEDQLKESNSEAIELKESQKEAKPLVEKSTQQIELESEHHVTPPGDPEFPAAEYDFGTSLVSKAEEVKVPEASVLTEVNQSKDEEVSQILTPLGSNAYADVAGSNSEKSHEPIKPKWNWGAFAFPLFFGVAHRVYLGLLILLVAIPGVGPLFGIIWSIIFGFNGEKWALENRDNRYRDEEEFRKNMDGWNRAGLIGFILYIVVGILIVAGLILLIFFVYNDNVNSFQNIN